MSNAKTTASVAQVIREHYKDNVIQHLKVIDFTTGETVAENAKIKMITRRTLENGEVADLWDRVRNDLQRAIVRHLDYEWQLELSGKKAGEAGVPKPPYTMAELEGLLQHVYAWLSRYNEAFAADERKFTDMKPRKRALKWLMTTGCTLVVDKESGRKRREIKTLAFRRALDTMISCELNQEALPSVELAPRDAERITKVEERITKREEKEVAKATKEAEKAAKGKDMAKKADKSAEMEVKDDTKTDEIVVKAS